jgi:hypothetical protein
MSEVLSHVMHTFYMKSLEINYLDFFPKKFVFWGIYDCEKYYKTDLEKKWTATLLLDKRVFGNQSVRSDWF